MGGIRLGETVRDASKLELRTEEGVFEGDWGVVMVAASLLGVPGNTVLETEAENKLVGVEEGVAREEKVKVGVVVEDEEALPPVGVPDTLGEEEIEILLDVVTTQEGVAEKLFTIDTEFDPDTDPDTVFPGVEVVEAVGDGVSPRPEEEEGTRERLENAVIDGCPEVESGGETEGVEEKEGATDLEGVEV